MRFNKRMYKVFHLGSKTSTHQHALKVTQLCSSLADKDLRGPGDSKGSQLVPGLHWECCQQVLE